MAAPALVVVVVLVIPALPAGRHATAAHWLLVASPAGRDQSPPPDSGLQQ